MTKVKAKFLFGDPGYIGLPYWPERATLIDISKEVHAKLGAEKKLAATRAACDKRGITPDQYQTLTERAARPFYTVDESLNGEIVIPERVVQSFINHASQEVPKAIPRISSKGLTFIGVKLEDRHLRTGKTVSHAKSFDRFVKMEESNQRIFSSTPYIADFTAEGVFCIDEEIIQCENLLKLLEYGGRMYGIGGARPQGFGRFKVAEWDIISRVRAKNDIFATNPATRALAQMEAS